MDLRTALLLGIAPLVGLLVVLAFYIETEFVYPMQQTGDSAGFLLILFFMGTCGALPLIPALSGMAGVSKKKPIERHWSE